ncbi:MAG: OmcA/MtrC family decaheme c-type cytochrome [Bryobacteraceae bacterium]|nr:OmcA/MtrC family decaheme c-type cytochrome [Bryobacteraceae bacterium]
MNFVRPGLRIQITRAEAASDGTVRVTFKLSDPRGLPLDREGITTPGVINTSFVLARIPSGSKFYSAYTTRNVTSPINGRAATQAAADTGGSYAKVADGEYTYTFGAKLPPDADRTATHSVLIYSNRNLTEFDLGTNYFDTVFSWVPGGGAVSKTRDVVRTATCNKCHTDMGFHGGSRRSMEGCVMCHTPQTTDPDTGNTVDMTTMIHKIHMGTSLPANQNGGKYCIIGFNQSELCYDKVVFPAGPKDCATCHDTKLTGANRPAQVDAHLTSPSRQACGACHEKVNFATGQGHATGLPQSDDSRCASCHIPQGEREFDASIAGAHVIAERAASLPGFLVEIVSVEDGVAGRRPRVTFTVKNKAGEPIPLNQVTRLGAVLAGPTSDYANYWDENALTATDAGGGRYTHTFAATIPADARGTFTIGMEGYKNFTLLEGTTRAVTVRDAGVNVLRNFAVDGGAVQPRRQVVSVDKCNACHSSLSLHGGNRNRIEQCVLCHNPNKTDAARRPADRMPAESVNFASMIHRIHTGNQQTRPYSIFGFGNTEHDYSHAGYPGIGSECSMCHVNNSHRLPLADGLLPVNDPRGYNAKPGPESAACTGCHASKAAASHAAINSNAIGESCSACHGLNSQFSVDKVHAR